MSSMNAARRLFAAAALTAAVASVAGCGVKVSDDTAHNTKTVLCASSESSIAALEASGALARGVGALIRDNTTDPKIKALAADVAANHSDEAGRQRLADWLRDQCR